MGRKDRFDKSSESCHKDTEVPVGLSLQDAKKLLANLRLHQTELEMQNEELKRAQEVIEEGRQRLSDLYDLAPVGYLTLKGENSAIVEANLTAAALLGVARQQLIGITFLQYIDPEYIEEYLLHRKSVAQGNHKTACELRLRRRGGALFWGRLESVAVQPAESDGTVVSFRTAIIDITEKKQAENALRESEEKYRALVESVNSIIVRLDDEGRVVFLNDYGRDFFGYSGEELFGRGLVGTILPSEKADPLDLKALVASFTDDLEGNRAKEVENMRRNGEKVWVSWTTRTLRDEEGLFAGILAVGNDITQRKRLEDGLHQAQKMEAIGTLAGGIAHDFNNILAAIIGFAEIVEEDLPRESPSIPRIQRVLNAASRGRDLVRQILAFSRKTELTRTPISLFPVIKETAQLLRASLPATIDIRHTVKGAGDTILASPVEVQQIVMNLATNAYSAMKETGGILSIDVTNVAFRPNPPVLDADIEPGEYVQLSVTDTGCGMTADVMKRVFDPFFTTKGVGEGTGMGLAVVYGIVKSLHGTVSVESEPGTGSTFRVLLPLAVTGEQPGGGEPSVTPGGTERILYVDDEKLLAEWGKDALERLGYTVTALTDSTAALTLFSADPTRFDVVIVDQTMPKLTGLNLARKLLTQRGGLPIILCTGHSDIASLQKAKEAGIKEFLMKPLGKQALAEAIRRVLHSAEHEA
jgi:two-component system, cell cycle sensor histidine kinase and response regulator CckA